MDTTYFLIFAGLIGWLGWIWKKAILEDLQQKNRIYLENYKKDLDIVKATILRFSEDQFKHYQNLWDTLYSTKISADLLWEENNNNNFIQFIKQLKKTTDIVERSLLIDDGHYNKLIDILSKLKKYKDNKGTMIDLNEKLLELQDINQINIICIDIKEYVEENKQIKEEYEKLITEVKIELKRKIVGVSSY